jgi:hypothetical protein
LKDTIQLLRSPPSVQTSVYIRVLSSSTNYIIDNIGTRFVDPPLFFLYFNSSLLWDVFIINSVEQLQTLQKTQSENDISPFLKTQKLSILYRVPMIDNIRRVLTTILPVEFEL